MKRIEFFVCVTAMFLIGLGTSYGQQETIVRNPFSSLLPQSPSFNPLPPLEINDSAKFPSLTIPVKEPSRIQQSTNKSGKFEHKQHAQSKRNKKETKRDLSLAKPTPVQKIVKKNIQANKKILKNSQKTEYEENKVEKQQAVPTANLKASRFSKSTIVAKEKTNSELRHNPRRHSRASPTNANILFDEIVKNKEPSLQSKLKSSHHPPNQAFNKSEAKTIQKKLVLKKTDKKLQRKVPRKKSVSKRLSTKKKPAVQKSRILQERNVTKDKNTNGEANSSWQNVRINSSIIKEKFPILTGIVKTSEGLFAFFRDGQQEYILQEGAAILDGELIQIQKNSIRIRLGENQKVLMIQE
ncbi:MAG: hypothetical protein HQM13_14695 [SAR324 cluster bacterium]|nr:hypothetical protein [SAR324 cluster bacterium]